MKVFKIPGDERAVCHHCGKVVTRKRSIHSGKGRRKHQCPHGNDCGSSYLGLAHANLANKCSRCYWEFGRVHEALRRARLVPEAIPTWTELHATISERGFDIPNGKDESLALIAAIEGKRSDPEGGLDLVG